MGYVDEDGYLYLTDRSTFMIVSGGVNIYPQEAENLLVMHPKLVDAAVFGVPNDGIRRGGQGRRATGQRRRRGPELEAELIAYCRAHLASYKCPRTVEFDPELSARPERQAVQAADPGTLLAGTIVTNPVTRLARSCVAGAPRLAYPQLAVTRGWPFARPVLA